MSVVLETDRRLADLANNLLDRRPDLAEALLAKVEKLARRRKPAVDTVGIDSRVSYRLDDGKEQEVELVYPEQADIAAGKISVTTPVGATLFGMASGSSAPLLGNDGRKRTLTVLATR